VELEFNKNKNENYLLNLVN